MRDDILIIIPARGGSKGIPRKNIKPLNGKPLIYYAIDTARAITADENICVSTDDVEIKSVVEAYGLQVPFLRPNALSTDTAGTYEVLIHALNFYEEQGKQYNTVLLLQTTSPFRTAEQVKEALEICGWPKSYLRLPLTKMEPENAMILAKEMERVAIKKVNA